MTHPNGSSSTPASDLSMAQLTSIRARLASLEDSISSIADAVRGVQRPSALPHPPWNWSLLTEQQRETAWTDLVDWVDWWVETYELETRLTPCWGRHPGVVQHILALRWAHREVWAPMSEGADRSPVVRSASARSLVEWHLVTMPGVLEAARQSLSGCNATDHGDGGDRARRAQARRAMRAAAADAYIGEAMRAET